jgi:maleate cis-trans isomerase
MPAPTAEELQRQIAAYLNSRGWDVSVIGGLVVQEQKRLGLFEFVCRFSGAKLGDAEVADTRTIFRAAEER